MMEPIDFLPLAGAFISVFIADLVYYRNSKSLINRIFFMLGVSNAVLLTAEFGSVIAANAGDAMFWEYIDAFWPFRMAFFVASVLAFTERWGSFSRDRKKYAALFGVASVFFALYVYGLVTASTLERTAWGWKPIFSDDTAGMAATAVNGIMPPLFIFPSIVVGLIYYLKAEEPRKRKQAAYIMAGISIPAILSVLTDAVLPFFFSTSLPETGSVFLLSSLFLAYGIWKYELLVLTPEKVAAEIVQTMPDALILMDGTRRNISTVNPALLGLLGYRKGELEGKPLTAVFPPEFNDYGRILGEDIDKVEDLSAEVLTKKGQRIAVSVSASTTRYDRKNVKYTVIIFRDITEREMAKQEISRKTGELEKKTLELEKANHELKRINDLAVGRELKMIELKKKIAQLEKSK